MREEEFIREPELEKRNPGTLGKEIVQMLFFIGVVIVLTFLIVEFVGQRTRVEGNSMYPTLHNKDNLWVDKLQYRFHDIERFDIIVFEYPGEPDTHYIKRVIGLPGETVQIIDSVIYIDGQVLEENYGAEKILNPKAAKDPIVLGADEYFVLGDNRNDSQDSRDPILGNIKRSQIVGKAWIRIFPLDRIGLLRHQ